MMKLNDLAAATEQLKARSFEKFQLCFNLSDPNDVSNLYTRDIGPAAHLVADKFGSIEFVGDLNSQSNHSNDQTVGKFTDSKPGKAGTQPESRTAGNGELRDEQGLLVWFTRGRRKIQVLAQYETHSTADNPQINALVIGTSNKTLMEFWRQSDGSYTLALEGRPTQHVFNRLNVCQETGKLYFSSLDGIQGYLDSDGHWRGNGKPLVA
ncbi:MAG TPA: hypothetical protein V6D17_05070 [Candidatus Obscuribacterales bacterium]